MSNPKEYGKLVADLTPAELTRERDRCRTMFRYLPKGPARESAQKRLTAMNFPGLRCAAPTVRSRDGNDLSVLTMLADCGKPQKPVCDLSKMKVE
jgi:hypothetical protein